MSQVPDAGEPQPDSPHASLRPWVPRLVSVNSSWPLPRYRLGDAVVLEVPGPLSATADELDRAIQHAIAEEPRGVVCDLSGVHGAIPGCGLNVLNDAARQARDWPGVPVAVVCSSPEVRDALDQLPLRAHLRVTGSVLAALAAFDQGPGAVTAALRLPPHPTAARAARDFLTRECLDQGRGHGIATGCLVVSELVGNAIVHAGTDVHVTLGWLPSSMRVAVRDRSPNLPRRRRPGLNRPRGRGLLIVEGCCRTWGVLATADGGKVVWAVLDV